MMIRYCNIFLCALLIGCNIPLEKKTKEELPNILFLFADDFTYDAINALGNDIIQTPNLDRLVQMVLILAKLSIWEDGMGQCVWPPEP